MLTSMRVDMLYIVIQTSGYSNKPIVIESPASIAATRSVDLCFVPYPARKYNIALTYTQRKRLLQISCSESPTRRT